MRLMRLALVSGMLVGGLAVHAGADERVTVLLRNGEKTSGQLEAVHQGSVWVRVTSPDQRKLPYDNVALFDFVSGGTDLPANEIAIAKGAPHLLVLRDGNSVKGRLERVEGGEGSEGVDSKLTWFFRSEGGEERRLSTNQIARLYLGNYPAPATETPPPTVTPPPTPGTRSVTVPATRQWVDTGILVRQGQNVSFSATGQIQLSADGNDVAGTAGALTQRRAPRSPVPTVFVGALIGRIGQSDVFAIGNQDVVQMPGSGRLWIGINDDTPQDNSGQFDVRITTESVNPQNNRDRSRRRRP